MPALLGLERGQTRWLEDDRVCVDEDEISAWAEANPQPYQRESYQGAYQGENID